MRRFGQLMMFVVQALPLGFESFALSGQFGGDFGGFAGPFGKDGLAGGELFIDPRGLLAGVFESLCRVAAARFDRGPLPPQPHQIGLQLADARRLMSHRRLLPGRFFAEVGPTPVDVAQSFIEPGNLALHPGERRLDLGNPTVPFGAGRVLSGELGFDLGQLCRLLPAASSKTSRRAEALACRICSTRPCSMMQ
jgi:hypothetical protein